MDTRLDGKTALVTGASSGLGRHFATVLAAEGATVLLAARRREALDEACAEIRAAGGRAYLEVVSLDAESELRSARAAIDLEVDCLLGGTRAETVAPMLRAHPVRYFPFPGEIVSHPTSSPSQTATVLIDSR